MKASRLIRSLLFPPKCVSCKERLPFESQVPFCKDCMADWEKEKLEVCGFCQKPVETCRCATPSMKSAGISTLFKLAYYKTGQKSCPDRVLFWMKESASERLYSFLAERLAKQILAGLQEKKIPLSDCLLTYTPRHRRELLRTGMDQAERLAKALSGELGIRAVVTLRRKRTKNKLQKKLSAAERVKNAKAAFAIQEGIDLFGKTMLLVDDTVTTGATMSAAARLLKGAGAARVFGVAVTLDEIGRYPKEESLSTKPYF